MKANVKIVTTQLGYAIYIEDTRVAGSKPFGGGSVLAEYNVKVDYILDSISHLSSKHPALNTEAAGYWTCKECDYVLNFSEHDLCALCKNPRSV